jgi:hypothetical protein
MFNSSSDAKLIIQTPVTTSAVASVSCNEYSNVNIPAIHQGLLQPSVRIKTTHGKFFSATQKPTQAMSITNSIYNSRPYYGKAKAINVMKLFFHLPLKLGNICPGF